MRKIRIAMTWAFTLISFSLFAQTKEVTGKVTDQTGAGIPSATIRIKGLKRGTSADINGTFKLNAPLNAVLIISGVGFDPVEVSVADRTTITSTCAITRHGRVTPTTRSLPDRQPFRIHAPQPVPAEEPTASGPTRLTLA